MRAASVSICVAVSHAEQFRQSPIVVLDGLESFVKYKLQMNLGFVLELSFIRVFRAKSQ